MPHAFSDPTLSTELPEVALGLTGFELMPAGLVAIVIVALGSALVIAAMRRRERGE